MRVLVLGNSDTAGLFADGRTWTQVAAARVAEGLGEESALTETRFWALMPTAPEMAVRKVREAGAEVVILPLGSFAFTVGFVWVRVRRLFGSRVAARYRRAEERFDSGTRRAGGIRTKANGWARRVVRAVVGVEAPHTVEETAAGYRAVLRALSRLEDVDVVIVEYPAERGRNVVGGDVGERRARFAKLMRAEAEAHRYRVLASAETLGAAGEDGEFITPDGFHLSAAGHARLGEAVAAVVLGRAEAGTKPAPGA